MSHSPSELLEIARKLERGYWVLAREVRDIDLRKRCMNYDATYEILCKDGIYTSADVDVYTSKIIVEALREAAKGQK